MFHQFQETFIFDPNTEFDEAIKFEAELDKQGINYKKSITTTAIAYVLGSHLYPEKQWNS